MRPFGAAAVALWLLLVGPAAFAADYPFSGFYTFAPPGETPAKARLYCGFVFFDQGMDGTYVNYHLDLPRFLADATVRFVEYGRGICTAMPNEQIETCLSTSDTDPEVQGKTFYDVFRRTGPDTIELFYFDGIAAAQAFVAAGAGTREPEGGYSLCPGFDAASLAKYLSAERSKLSPDERLKMTSPNLDEATMATMTRVLETVGAGK